MKLSDPAAERAVIASVFKGGSDIFADVADIVTSRTFTIDSNQAIWACLEHVCKDQNDARPDYPTLMSSAHALGLDHIFQKQEEREHLRAVMNMPVRAENTRRLAGKIRKLEVARLLGDQLEVARSSLNEVTGNEPIDSILSGVEGPIFDFTSLLANSDTNSIRRMGDGAEEYLTHLMDNPREMMGISTGLPRFDAAIGGGLRPNSMDIIAARVKTGKSFIVDHIALHVAGKLGIPVLNLDTEMSWEEHLHRVSANLAGVPINDIERGKCGANRHKVLQAGKRLKDIPYDYRCITGEAFEDTLSHMRRWVLKTVGLQANGKAKPCVILFDYLKLMSSDSLKSGNMAEYQMLGFIATALKNFASRYGVACPTFAQLNRDGIDKEDTSAMSQSDRIVWFCTSLSYYKRKSDEEKAEQDPIHKFTHKLLPVVCRHGEGLQDGDYINIKADYRIAKIEEGPTRRQLEKGVTGNAGQSQAGVILDDAAAREQDTVKFGS